MTDHHQHHHDYSTHGHHHHAAAQVPRIIAASPTLSLLRLSALYRLAFALGISTLLWAAVAITVR